MSSVNKPSSRGYEFIPPDLPNKCTWHLNTKEKSVHRHTSPVKVDKSKILPNILHAIGSTPMVRLNKIPQQHGLKCELVVKCEFLNPGGSVKDRIAIRMIEEAEKDKKIVPGYTIIEPTSGNTGIGLALVSAVKGYKSIIIMPEKMSKEKASVLKALGSDIIRSPTGARYNAPESHIGMAQKVNSQIAKSIVLDQYRNSANPLTHYDTTAEEILEQCDDQLDMIVIGAGTCGTITGIGRKVKERCPNCKVIGVDPYGSILAEPADLNITSCTGYDVEGIGKDFIPTNLDRSVVDQWVKTNDREGFFMARSLIKDEGLLCGGSSGSAVCAAVKVAKGLKAGQRCVVLLPDSIRNYLTKFIDDSWMTEKEYLDIDLDMSLKHWWWDIKVSNLSITEPLTILPQLSCQQAIDIMKRECCDQLPVVDKNGVIKGVVTLGNLMAKIVAGKVLSSALVSEVLYTTFNKISLETTLGRLSRVLDLAHFALIVHSKEQCGERDKVETKEAILGVVTQIDLINFITHAEEHKDRYINGSCDAPLTNGFH